MRQNLSLSPMGGEGHSWRKIFLSGLILIAVLIAGLLATPANAQDREVSSIAEFVAAKETWDRSVGQPYVLEGRYTVFSSSEVRFKNCEMRFLLARPYRGTRGESRNIEVAGQIVRQDGDLVFRVTDLKPRESDREMLVRKRSQLDSSRPEGVYELASWTRQRGEFYDDDQLREAAQQLYEEGLTIAYQHLEPGDIAGLRELAKKAGEFSASENLRLRYLHEANRLQWQAEQSKPEPDFRRILSQIRSDLPGATTPLPRHRLSVRKDYQKTPEAYRLASEQTRRLLDRAFYLEVGLAELAQDATEDGRNGYEIARRIERSFPELSALAETYRQQELKYLNARLGQLTRTQIVELSERYESRNDPRQARDVVRSWLRLQVSRAQQGGPTELMELGDEYVNLLSDQRAAARMYKLAYRQNPRLNTSAEWLRTHGYQLHGATWSKPGEIEEDPDESMVTEAIQEGRVQIGMTGEQVRKALGSKPSSVIRMASAGQIDELWVFQDFGITVRLNRRSTASTSHVVATSTID